MLPAADDPSDERLMYMWAQGLLVALVLLPPVLLPNLGALGFTGACVLASKGLQHEGWVQ